MKSVVTVSCWCLGLLCAGAAGAHHSFSAFDATQTLTVSGTVKEWQWTNPHTWLTLVLPGANGIDEEWSLEGQSPQVLRREQLLPRDVMKPGDKVSVTLHPRRDGSHGGSLLSVVLLMGTTRAG